MLSGSKPYILLELQLYFTIYRNRDCRKNISIANANAIALGVKTIACII